MGDVKMTAEERVRRLQFYAEWSANGHGGDVVHSDDAIRAAEEHAAAAVENLEARVAELERERDEARMRSTQLRCELAQALKCIAELEASIDEENC